MSRASNEFHTEKSTVAKVRCDVMRKGIKVFLQLWFYFIATCCWCLCNVRSYVHVIHDIANTHQNGFELCELRMETVSTGTGKGKGTAIEIESEKEMEREKRVCKTMKNNDSTDSSSTKLIFGAPNEW